MQNYIHLGPILTVVGPYFPIIKYSSIRTSKTKLTFVSKKLFYVVQLHFLFKNRVKVLKYQFQTRIYTIHGEKEISLANCKRCKKTIRYRSIFLRSHFHRIRPNRKTKYRTLQTKLTFVSASSHLIVEQFQFTRPGSFNVLVYCMLGIVNIVSAFLKREFFFIYIESQKFLGF